MKFQLTGQALWNRMERAVQKVQERLERTAVTLENAKVPYAIVGGNAVRAWVAQADETAVRTTRDVDILIRREDFPRVVGFMEAAGFVHHFTSGVDMFLDGPDSTPRDAVHVLFAGEKVLADHLLPAPDVDDALLIERHNIVSLEALVRMKLVAFRTKDRMHLIDMLDVGLVDESWLGRVPKELVPRLQELLDDPESGPGQAPGFTKP